MKRYEQQTLWTALVTPMHEGGEVDFRGLEELVARQAAAGNGILLLGSTGEGLALSPKEKSDVVRFVAGLRPGVPLMAGVGGFNIALQQAWIEECNGLEIDAYLLVTPLYSKPGPVGLRAWFEALLDRAERPCMLYNIPGRTGLHIPPGVVGELSDHPRAWSLKEASGELKKYREYRQQVPSIAIYSGDDAHLPAYAGVGCNGLVSVAANLWPEATSRYVELTLKGKSEAFESLWKEASLSLFCSSNPIPAKLLLREKGLIGSAALRLPLTDREPTDMERLRRADRAVTEWYEGLPVRSV